MSRTSDIYLQDIVDAISRIESYVEGTTRLAFETDRMRFDAVIRNLEIIGEAVKRVPNPIRKNHPSVAWRKIAGLRDRLIHAYFDIDIDIIWDIVHSELPILKTQVREIIEEKSR
jgi:uncharacterized protein with HEPN domain